MHKLAFYITLFFVSFANGQTKNNDAQKLKKLGILYSNAKQNNILFSDKDYDYKTSALKIQLFYLLKKKENWNMNLILQPQIQIAEHQLLNEQFITPDEENYTFLREKFTRRKNISLYAFELGFQFQKELSKSLLFEVLLGLGVAYIDVETERLAQGFTFIENISLGIAYCHENSEIYLGSNFGHVSNFNIKIPNSGYNIFGFEIGYRIKLN
ncbi:MAG: Uncharacterised protein [Flavobacterium sp. SCGC AAA160-P02]|nr:MAG: Uncharacterised protein [Flavobacterium sp. SCGC AAA160-P02]